VFDTQSHYQEVSISCCVMYTVTTSGGKHLVLFDTQPLYQEVSISCCVIYKVMISGD